MKILVEGIKYNTAELSKIFDDSKFYIQKGNEGIIISVGYYHSFLKNELVYMLPKVFLNNGLLFGIYSPNELLDEEISVSIKHENKYAWIRKLLIYFYNSIAEFKKRHFTSSIIDFNTTFTINTNIGEKEYSYLDLVLSFTNFYKKNKNVLLFNHIEKKSKSANNTKWNKTFLKNLPIIDADRNPIYTEFNNRKKLIDYEEELLLYFLSIINHFNEEHSLKLQIDKSFSIIKGEKFNHLRSNGLSKLRKIKHRYFSDFQKRLYQLCELYFSQTDNSSPKKKREEFISVRNYNIIFEDMIDKLFSDNFNIAEKHALTLSELKNNKDGKIIDHIYEDRSLIDDNNIFYIGDSKYYKPGHEVGSNDTALFKQYTYSKNIIQYNINLFNHTKKYYNQNIRYRDEITEGYSITPNFFIYGYVEKLDDFDNPNLLTINKPHRSYHFKERLFDRDTLFVQQYKINFLFVIKAYTTLTPNKIIQFQKKIKKNFREQFLNYFNSKESGYVFYEKNITEFDLVTLLKSNFKRLNGKCYFCRENKLIIAKYYKDDSINDILIDAEEKKLT